MKTLYLHIGTVKTGTSAIQLFLENNAVYLAENSFAYPMMPYHFAYRAYRRNACFMNTTLHANNGDDDCTLVNNCLEAVSVAFKQVDNVILSDEGLFWHIMSHDKNRIDMLLHYAEVNNITVKIIIYLRRQDLLMDSLWNQTIKHNARKSSFAEYVQEYKNSGRLNYYNMVEDLAELFGSTNIIVRRYQREDLVGGSSVTDFLNMLGLKIPEDISTNYDATATNLRLPNNLAYYKQQINYYSTAGRAGATISETAFNRAANQSRVAESETALMSEDEARAFVEEYEESNNMLASKYIGDEQPLFNNHYSHKEKWSPNNVAMMEDILRGTAAMFGELQGIIEKQNERISKLEKQNKRLLHVLRHPITSQFHKLVK